MLSTDILKALLNTLDSVSPSRTTMPILKTLHLFTHDGKLNIAASNIESNLILTIDYDDKPIDCCVPSKELKDIVTTVQSESVRLEQKAQGLYLYDGKHKTRFKYLSGDEFPRIEESEMQLELSGDILHNLLTKAQVCCSEKNDHTSLTGIALISKDGVFTALSADGFRAFCSDMLLGIADFQQVIIPKIDNRVLGLLTGKIECGFSQYKATFKGSNFIYQTTLIGDVFPDIKRAFPTDHNAEIIIDKGKLRNAIRRAMVFAKNTDNVVLFEVADGILQVSSEDDTGENSMRFEIEQSGNNIKLGMNGKFASEILSVLDDKVMMRFTDPKKPMIIKSPESETYSYVLMPMQVRRR